MKLVWLWIIPLAASAGWLWMAASFGMLDLGVLMLVVLAMWAAVEIALARLSR